MRSVTAEPTAVAARRVRAALDTLLDPDASEWSKAAEAVLELAPTPLESQPSAYVQESWRERHRGDAGEVSVRALQSAKAVALRLEWRASRPVRLIDDYNVFADACAVLFPANGREAELSTMGSPKAGVRGWYWRAGTELPFSITAHGLGSVERDPEHELVARARWHEDRWAVVMGRPLSGAGAAFEAGGEVPVAFAVWSGAARERAGLKSHTPIWHQLDLGGERRNR